MENQAFVMDHPLIQHKLTYLRDKNTGSKEFRELVGEIAMLMCYEATRDLPLQEVHIETPMGEATTKVIAGRKLAFVPILRAGLGMVEGVLEMVPAAKVGHIGLSVSYTHLLMIVVHHQNTTLVHSLKSFLPKVLSVFL